MPYTQNPHMPKVRQEAAYMVQYKGYAPAEVGRRYGVGSSTICKWVKKAKFYGYHPIPTLSSKPKHHPRELPAEIIDRIVDVRLEHNRCSEVVHETLTQEGVSVSLSSVKRTLERNYLLKKRSLWKRYHPHIDRPYVQNPGDLIELDTIHLMTGKKSRIYVFTLIDVHSRFVYAQAYEKINGKTSVMFLKEAQRHASFKFNMIQTDHGPEFGTWFVTMIEKQHRYTRIGKPNDNAHIERLNRTIQEECLDRHERKVEVLNKALRAYLNYYNNDRLHLGIKLKTPMQLLAECVQAID
jgi:transposase InsO family protein